MKHQLLKVMSIPQEPGIPVDLRHQATGKANVDVQKSFRGYCHTEAKCTFILITEHLLLVMFNSQQI